MAKDSSCPPLTNGAGTQYRLQTHVQRVLGKSLAEAGCAFRVLTLAVVSPGT